MRIFMIFMVTIVLSSCIVYTRPITTVSAELYVDDEGMNGYYVSMGNYYRVPEREIIIIRDRGIPYDEMPVILFISQRARVTPTVIIDLRRRNMSWMDITLYYRLSPDIYYVPIQSGPPHGHAYGHYMNKPKKEWKNMHFKDNDIVNLVNLKFVAEHNKQKPDEIVKMRENGKNFKEINNNVKINKNKGHDNGKDHIKGKR
jgi:hypothetical protein